MKLIKVVVIGPESTGKTTLCEQLAEHYRTEWCPEFAREYLLTHAVDYSYEDLLTIAKGQIDLEDKHESNLMSREQESAGLRLTTPSVAEGLSPTLQSFGDGAPKAMHDSRLLIVDTDMYVMKVWCEFVFEKCHRFILDQIVKRKYDLYLLCNVDLPWIPDELREYPSVETRKKLFAIYKDAMINQPVPWTEINGSYEERLQKAITAVDELLGK